MYFKRCMVFISLHCTGSQPTAISKLHRCTSTRREGSSRAKHNKSTVFNVIAIVLSLDLPHYLIPARARLMIFDILGEVAEEHDEDVVFSLRGNDSRNFANV